MPQTINSYYIKMCHLDTAVAVYRDGKCDITRILHMNDGVRLVGGMLSEDDLGMTHRVFTMRRTSNARVSILCENRTKYVRVQADAQSVSMKDVSYRLRINMRKSAQEATTLAMERAELIIKAHYRNRNLPSCVLDLMDKESEYLTSLNYKLEIDQMYEREIGYGYTP